MGGKGKQTDRKKGVPFRVMFRHHKDPAYYDPKANDKIFVPEISGKGMTDDQKKIIDSFPEKDRGIYKEGENPDVIEHDPLEAIVKKMKIKNQEKKMKKNVRFEDEEGKGGDNEEDYDSDDIIDDSEEEGEYDDEEEEYEQDEESKEVLIVKQKINKDDDANEVVKNVQKFKPAEGVKFTQYDEYGLPKDDGFDYKQFIVTDEMKPGDMYIEAPPEMVEKMLRKAGIHKDIDKEISQMNEEEKAVFQCLEVDGDEYEELDDDFLLLANEGKPALEIVEASAADNNQDYANKGVVIVRDEEEEQLQEMRANYKKILAATKRNAADGEEDEEEGEEEGEEEEEEEQEEDLKDDKVKYDKKFEDIMENEYADDQIGDAEGEVEQEDLISKELLDEAVEEFIESQKLRDRKMYAHFNEGEREVVPRLQSKQQAIEDEEVETEQDKKDLIQKALKINEMIEEEYAERGSESSESESEDEDKKWDCQTIISTFSNTDNHPGIIKTTRIVKPKNKMELHKQFKVPIEGLMAEEVTKETLKKQKKSKAAKPFEAVEEIESDHEDAADADAEGDNNEGDDKKEKKKQQKQERREKRKLKKELKLAFKSQNIKLVKATTTEIGAIKTGVSVKKIY